MQQHGEVQLNLELWKSRFHPCHYHFLCDQVKGFLESMCKKYLIRVSCNLSKYGSIEQVKSFLDRLTILDVQVISQTLGPIEDLVLQTNQFPPVSSRTIVTDVFRKCIYYKFANCLRQEAFKAISDDLNIQDPFCLTSYFSLMKSTGGGEQVAFCREEWDRPLYERISETLIEPISKWESRILSELLENAETLLTTCHKIFMFFGGSTRKAVLKEIMKVLDQLLSKNDAKWFQEMFLGVGDSQTLKRLFDLFQDDKCFLDTIAYHSSQLYSDLIYGEDNNENHELCKDEETVKRILQLWFQIHSVVVQQNVKRPSVQVAFVDPFMPFTDSAANYPDTVTKVLTEFVSGLISSSLNGCDRLNQSSLENLLAVSSLSNIIPAAEPFPEALRVFLSRYLLQCSSSNIEVDMLSKVNAVTDQSDATKGLSMLIEDACDWDLYRSQVTPIFQPLQETIGETEIDVRLVHRPLWELGPDVDFVFNTNVQAASDSIVRNFQSRYPARSASIHSLVSQMIIRSNVWTYNGEGIRICLSTSQMGVLETIGDEEICFGELSKRVLVNCNAALGLSALVAILKSMMNEHPILKKKPDNTDFSETDAFSLNLQFQPKSALIKLPFPEYLKESAMRRDTTARNHNQRLNVEQVVRAAVMKLLKQEREVEMSGVKGAVVERLSGLYDLTQVNFENILRKLEADEYVTVEGSIVKYVL